MHSIKVQLFPKIFGKQLSQGRSLFFASNLNNFQNRYTVMTNAGIIKKKDFSKAWRYMDQNKLTLRLANESDGPAIAKSLDAIMMDEPICLVLPIKPGMWEYMINQFVNTLIKDQLTVAIFDEKNKPVGISLSHDYTTDYEISDCPEPLMANVEFDNGASSKFKNSQEWQKGQFLYLYLLGVAEAHRGQQLSSVLLAEQAKIGFERKFDFLYADSSNIFTEKGFRSLFVKFEQTHTQIFKDFVDSKGKRPYEKLDGYGCGVLGKLK